MKPVKYDLTGQRFGKLTVIRRADNLKREVMWQCQCDCGNTYIARGPSLRSGATTHCGCVSHMEDLVGSRFGRWEVIDRAPNKGLHTVWRCRCDCGKEADVYATNLRRGFSTSCGCYRETYLASIRKHIWTNHGDYATIESCGRTIFIDEEDVARLSEYCVFISSSGAVKMYRQENKKRIYGAPLSHFLLGTCPSEIVIDHIDRNPLNNRKSNLRKCTITENNYNKKKTLRKTLSKFKGLTLFVDASGAKHWSALLSKGGIVYKSKPFETEEEAARAYDQLALKHHGEFACTNEMLGLYDE